MRKRVAIRVDGKGRLSIPAKVRQELGIVPGDLFVFRSEGGILQYAKVEENPFDILALHAIQESREGKTISIEDYAKENGIRMGPKRKAATGKKASTRQPRKA